MHWASGCARGGEVERDAASYFGEGRSYDGISSTQGKKRKACHFLQRLFLSRLFEEIFGAVGGLKIGILEKLQ